MPDDLAADFQALISDAEFAALFAPPRLRALLPPVGAAGVDPVLWLATLPRRHGALRQERWRLPGPRFDHVDARPRLLAELGAQAAQRRLQVAAAAVLSEAWWRPFTAAEAAARAGRLIETYADKEEVVVLFARTLDGRAHVAGAPLHRRSHSGRIAGYGAWRGLPGAEDQPTRVQAVLLEHFFRAYLERLVGGAAG